MTFRTRSLFLATLFAILAHPVLSQLPSIGTKLSKAKQQALLNELTTTFDTLCLRSIRPAEGFLKYDYLIPAGFYKQMWDWDGFFIGCYLASRSKEDAKYLKWWTLNFVTHVDSEGYAPGCMTTKGPRPIFGKFALKPFLSQGAYFASTYSGDFSWIKPVYEELKKVLAYRERTQMDSTTGLFYWDLSIQSGADNNPVLTNDSTDRSAILAVDASTFQVREYLATALIAQHLGFADDAKYFRKKAKGLEETMMNTMWSAQDKMFYNIRRTNGVAIKRISYSNFLPLFQGMLPRSDARAMIKQYLWNKKYMLAEYGIRSLSKRDPDYNNVCMIIPYSNWQGPIWINANFIFSVALKRYGFDEQANELAYVLAMMVLKDIKTCGSMHENYDADTGSPLAPTAEQSPGGVFTGFVGWNLLAQNMLEGAVEGKWMLLDLRIR